MYQRIISLVPSQTELLFDLGLNDRIIGVTKYCIHPPEAQQKTCIGGTKTLDINGILALKPDLILGNIEENTQAQIEMLRLTQNVVMSDIYTLADALAMIQHVGTLTGTSEKASEIAAKIQVKFSALNPAILSENENENPVNPAILPNKENPENPENPVILSAKKPILSAKKPILSAKKPKIAYFIWRKPYMIAAKNTFIDDMLTQIGFENAFADRTRYPEISVTDLENTEIDCIFLSSEPFPFKEKHIQELQKIKPSAIIKIVDGEMFSWYGSRLLLAADYFDTTVAFSRLYLERA